jgi:hypothetical protein
VPDAKPRRAKPSDGNPVPERTESAVASSPDGGDATANELTETPRQANADDSSVEQLPSVELLEHELISVLLEPPNATFARELSRDVGRRLKRSLPLLLIADALRHLSTSQRGSGPQGKMFLRSAVLQRVQREAEWIARPIVEPLPQAAETGTDALVNGPWVWRTHSLSVVTTTEGRWGVLHLWLKNDLDDVGIGQPLSVVLADGQQAYSWSPWASAHLPGGSCPEECRGSLASVAIEPQREILGHLSFALPADAAPDLWGLLDDDSVELRSCQATPEPQPAK